jgi:hypothetical protein
MDKTELFKRSVIFKRIDDDSTLVILFGHIRFAFNKPINYCIPMMWDDKDTLILLQEIEQQQKDEQKFAKREQ